MGKLADTSIIESTVIESRKFQEAYRFREGESNYEILADFIEINEKQINAITQFAGNLAGYVAITQKRNRDYFNESNGKVKNWVNRNLYQNPMETFKKQASEEVVGIIAAAATEKVLKLAAQGVYGYMGKKANRDAAIKVYKFLNNYVYLDADFSNTEKAEMELAKIRNGLPISEKEKNKLRDYTVSNTIPVSLANMDSISALNSDNNLCEALTYQLFDLYCYKYGDQNGVLAQCIANNDFTYKGMARLLEYYDYLGFTGNHAKELLRDNARRYDKINRDQRYYLEFGRKIIREFSLKLPEVNMNEVRNHCNMMIQYDPYRLRRKVVQRAVAGTGIGIGGLLLERPDIVMSGGSLALSQFNLEDGNLLEVMEKQFKEQGIGQNTFSNMLLSAKELKS